MLTQRHCDSDCATVRLDEFHMMGVFVRVVLVGPKVQNLAVQRDHAVADEHQSGCQALDC